VGIWPLIKALLLTLGRCLSRITLADDPVAREVPEGAFDFLTAAVPERAIRSLSAAVQAERIDQLKKEMQDLRSRLSSIPQLAESPQVLLAQKEGAASTELELQVADQDEI
jgi:hypothetical protein